MCDKVVDLAESLYISCTGTYHKGGTVTFFIQTFFIRDKVYTNFLYTGQNLYGTKFIRDKVYTGQSLYGDKIYTGTKFIRGQSLYRTKFIR
jgi:hypothetical protein